MDTEGTENIPGVLLLSATMDWGDATIRIQLRTSVSMAAAGGVRTAAGVFSWALQRFFTAVLVIKILVYKKHGRCGVEPAIPPRSGLCFVNCTLGQLMFLSHRCMLEQGKMELKNYALSVT